LVLDATAMRARDVDSFRQKCAASPALMLRSRAFFDFQWGEESGANRCGEIGPRAARARRVRGAGCLRGFIGRMMLPATRSAGGVTRWAARAGMSNEAG
jgi:hypothetical protein